MISIIVLSCVCLFLFIFHLLERNRHNKIQNDLLDRLMSRDYGEYASHRNHTEIIKKVKDRVGVNMEEADLEDRLPVM